MHACAALLKEHQEELAKLIALETGVVSVGKMTSGHAINIIPDTAEMIGNVRTFDVAVRDRLREGLIRIADGVVSTYRGSVETTYTELYPYPVVNDRAMAELFRDTAIQVAGADRVEESPMLMTSEDFSFYQAEIPGNFFFLGCGSQAKGTMAPHHSPRFNIDDDALPTGVSLLSAYACAVLEKLNSEEK